MRNDPDIEASRYRALKLVGLGIVIGWTTLWLGLGVQAGKLTGVGDRIERVADAFSTEPTTIPAPVQP